MVIYPKWGIRIIGETHRLSQVRLGTQRDEAPAGGYPQRPMARNSQDEIGKPSNRKWQSVDFVEYRKNDAAGHCTVTVIVCSRQSTHLRKVSKPRKSSFRNDRQ
jgi:hypothetical protein